MKAALLLVFSTLVLSGCHARLNVRLDTLDPAYVQGAMVVNRQVSACHVALLETDATVEHELAEVVASLVKHHDALSEATIKESESITDKRASMLVAALGEDMKITADNAWVEYALFDYREKRADIRSRIRSAAEDLGPRVDPCRFGDRELMGLLLERRRIIDEFSKQIDDSLNSLAAAAKTKTTAATLSAPPAASQDPASDPKVVATKQAVQTTIKRGILGGGVSLASIPYAYIVSSAPEQYWQERFNQAYGRSNLGNMDLAIVLNETADFSVKGLRFDASKVAQVASKVTAQSVAVAAQIATGGAVGQLTPQSAGSPVISPLSSANEALAKVQAADALRRANAFARDQALLDLAESLAAAHENGNDDNRNSIAAALRAKLQAQRALLTLSLAPATGP